MKIYYWENEGEKEFNTGELLGIEGKYSSGEHSGGIVVLAEDNLEAVNFAMERLGLKTANSADYLMKTITEFTEKKGVIYYGDGDC